jgi:GntR family transcriptional regulator
MSNFTRAYVCSRVPLYVEVASVIQQRIEMGYWRLGQKISTLEELEREFQVSRVTVRQAMKLLCREELLHPRAGRGTFVADSAEDRRRVVNIGPARARKYLALRSQEGFLSAQT